MDGGVLGGRDVTALKLVRAGALVEVKEPLLTYPVVDVNGDEVAVISDFFAEMRARGNSTASLRSYGMDLLRWFRFLETIGVDWQRASRMEARDFVLWMRQARVPGRRAGRGINAITGKRGTRLGFAAATINHAETVVRCFYDYLGVIDGAGPVVNPFPTVAVEGADRWRTTARCENHRMNARACIASNSRNASLDRCPMTFSSSCSTG